MNLNTPVRTLLASCALVVSLTAAAKTDIVNSMKNAGSIMMVDDTYASCYFTVKTSRNEFYITNSSPKDCGSVSKGTGRIRPNEMKIDCPSGYFKEGRIVGGPVGSYKGSIFYRSEILCRYNLAVPLGQDEGGE